jgi:hypothetical protein
MPRKARIQFPGAVYHLLDRGDRREPIVRDDLDRRAFYRDSSGLHLSVMSVGQLMDPAHPETSAQTTTFPPHPGTGETAGHNHTHDQQTDGTLFSPHDRREIGDVYGKAFYVAARDRKTGQVMVQRDRPSQSQENRDKHTDSATEALSSRQVKQLEEADKPTAIGEWTPLKNEIKRIEQCNCSND